MDIVIDASVALGWLLQSQAAPLSAAAEQAITGHVGWVPGHFGIEVARALRNHERRQLILPDLVDMMLAHLRDLPLKTDAGDPLDVLATAVGLARRHALRVADAAYLELAVRLGLPLATLDSSLARAAGEARVPLFSA